MDTKIPLPTDNIYKFYALFGLFIFIASISLIVFSTTSANDKIHSFLKEANSIQSSGNPSQKELTDLIEKRIQITLSDKEFFLRALTAVGTLGFFLMLVGFIVWHTKIQPAHDKMLKLQLLKLQKEIGLDKDNDITP